MFAIIASGIALFGLCFWVLSTIAEALFGMPPWKRRYLEKQALADHLHGQAQQATTIEFMQRVEAGGQLAPGEWESLYQANLLAAAKRYDDEQRSRRRRRAT